MHDRELVRAARSGSMEALRELYARYATAVFRSAYRILGTEPDAEDVLQDVFVGLSGTLSRFEDGRPLEPWLRRVAVRVALMKRRSDDRRGRRDSSWASHTNRERRRGRDEHGGEVEARLDLRWIVGRLPTPQRDVFLLKELEGFTHAEIAEELGITERASAGRLYRAWQSIREERAGS